MILYIHSEEGDFLTIRVKKNHSEDGYPYSQSETDATSYKYKEDDTFPLLFLSMKETPLF